MSNELVALAYRARVGNGTGKAVLAALADQANADGVCWPSISYIVERTEWDRKTVERWIAKLEEMGHLTTMRSKGTSSVYKIHPCVEPDDRTWVPQSQVPKNGSPRAAQGENASSTADQVTTSEATPLRSAESSSDATGTPSTIDSVNEPGSHSPMWKSGEHHVGNVSETRKDGTESPNTWVPQSQGVGTLGPKPGSHSPTNPKNPLLNPQLTSESEPDDLKNRFGAKTENGDSGGGESEVRRRARRFAQAAEDSATKERRKQQQLDKIRAMGVSV